MDQRSHPAGAVAAAEPAPDSPAGVGRPTRDAGPPRRRLMPLHPFLAEISQVALAVAHRHGFALGGGNALVLHGVVDRPTDDVDLFTDDEDGGVTAAAALVRDALRAAGLTVVDEPSGSTLGEVIDGFDDAMVQMRVHRGDDE